MLLPVQKRAPEHKPLSRRTIAICPNNIGFTSGLLPGEYPGSHNASSTSSGADPSNTNTDNDDPMAPDGDSDADYKRLRRGVDMSGVDPNCLVSPDGDNRQSPGELAQFLPNVPLGDIETYKGQNTLGYKVSMPYGNGLAFNKVPATISKGHPFAGRTAAEANRTNIFGSQ